jgi:hypothetical protein
MSLRFRAVNYELCWNFQSDVCMMGQLMLLKDTSWCILKMTGKAWTVGEAL